MALVTPWLLGVQDRFALLHGDYRLDNMLFSPDRSQVTIVDWQTLGVGLPTRDLAYFTGPAWNPRSVRRPNGIWSASTTPGCRPSGSPGRPGNLLARLPSRHAAGSADHRVRRRLRNLDRPAATI
jgi:hypothetical protein